MGALGKLGFGLVLLNTVLNHWALGATTTSTTNKREARQFGGFSGGGLGGGDQFGGGQPLGGAFPVAGPGAYSAYELPHQYGGEPAQYGGAPQYGAAPPYGALQYGSQNPPAQYGTQPQPYPPFGYKDPGFSVQTGFEGYLVPNSWYSLMPYGIEGIMVVVVSIIVIIVSIVAIVSFSAWATGFGDFAFLRESARSYLPDTSIFSLEYLNDVSMTVLDALDRYNELVKAE